MGLAMYDDVLGSLQKDHDSIRAMRELLAEELGRIRREGTTDPSRMQAILGYATHDPSSYHHAFEAYLIHRLATRRPEVEPVIHLINRRHRLVARFGRRLRAWLDNVGVDGFTRRLGFIWLARTYIAFHEALLRAEERRVFPLLRDCLTPGDWVEATTAFEWSLAPDMPRHLVDAARHSRPGLAPNPMDEDPTSQGKAAHRSTGS